MSGLPQSGSGNFNVFEQEDNTARGIKGFKFRDGPRGVNLHANGDGKHDYSTSFPVAMARGAAFDDDLEYHIGQAIGDEMLVVGQHDDAGADASTSCATRPGAARRRPTARIRSCSGASAARSPSACSSYVAACAKHYAANNIENGRQSANAMMDEQTLREIYARHFEMVIEEGGASSIMAAYNLVNGKKATQSQHLLNDLLRTDFGFQGFVLSDWWAMPNGANLSTMSSVLQATAVEAVQGGHGYGAALALQLHAADDRRRRRFAVVGGSHRRRGAHPGAEDALPRRLAVGRARLPAGVHGLRHEHRRDHQE